MKQLLLRGSCLVYILIGLEIFIMISPFAAFFYSLYGPFINMLHATAWTDWSTEFFLPHFVFPDSLFLRLVGTVQVLSLCAGLALFLLAAVPLYTSKFMRRGVVTRGLYRYIRHPQYLGLGIAGFGLLLYWPRFLILVTYLVMLFVYYALARSEEERMLRRFGESYRAYMDSVPMFLPGNPGGRLFSLLLGRVQPKAAAVAAIYAVVLAMSAGTALLLREHSVRTLRLVSVEGITALSVVPGTAEETARNVTVALGSSEVKERLAKRAVALVYIMPSDFFLMAIMTDLERMYPPDLERPAPSNPVARFFRIFFSYTALQTGLKSPEPHPLQRMIFIAAQDREGRPLSGRDVFAFGTRRYPVFHADLDLDSVSVLSVQDLRPRHKWGDAPMPLF